MEPISAWHIISYPRSVMPSKRDRSAYSARQKGIGIKSDTPIYQNKANKDGIISIKSDVPIGYKAHFLREMGFLIWST